MFAMVHEEVTSRLLNLREVGSLAAVLADRASGAESLVAAQRAHATLDHTSQGWPKNRQFDAFSVHRDTFYKWAIWPVRVVVAVTLAQPGP